MNYQLDQARDILSRTPAVLRTLLHDLPDVWIRSNEGPDTWSPFDVVGHLIHAEEEDWIPRARTILEHGETRAFAPFDRTAMFESSKGKTLEDLLATFALLRAESLRELEGLNITPELLEKRGMHPVLGPVTLGHLLSTWVAHDLSHTAQILRVMSRQYRDAVGPWRAFLPIMGG
jgi:hypothetical protein